MRSLRKRNDRFFFFLVLVSHSSCSIQLNDCGHNTCHCPTQRYGSTTTLTPHVPFLLLITMLNSVSNYLYERRARFVRSAGVAGGLYLVGQYATERIADMRDEFLEQRAAREKYVLVGSSSSPAFPSSLIPRVACANDSSRICRTSRLPS
jgi:hypothetical protein